MENELENILEESVPAKQPAPTSVPANLKAVQVATPPPTPAETKNIKKRGGRKWLAAIILAAVVIIALGVGGYVYGQKNFKPEKTLSKSIKKTQELNYFNFEVGIDGVFKARVPSSVFESSFDPLSYMVAGKVDEPLKIITVTLTSKGSSNIVDKNTEQLLAFTVKDEDENVISAEVRFIVIDENFYLKVEKLPGALSLIADFIPDSWIHFDTSGFVESEETMGFHEALGEVREEEFKNVKENKAELLAIFSDSVLSNITEKPSWLDILLKRDDLHYKIEMDKNALAEFFKDMSGIIAKGKGITDEYPLEDNKFIETVEKVTVEIWLDKDTQTFKKMYLSAKPSTVTDNEKFELVKIESLFTITPLAEPPVIKAPNEYMSFEELLGKIMTQMLGGVSPFFKQNLPEGVSDVDTDADGLTDFEELTIYGTDHMNVDTDGDGYSDGDEVQNGYNPKGEGKLKEDFFNPLEEARRKARDAKRVADIKQLQTALELYAIDNENTYPKTPSLELGNELGLDITCIDSSKGFGKNDCIGGGNMIMGLVPRDPAKLGTGNPCVLASTSECNYTYVQKDDGKSYEMYFFLESSVGDISGGLQVASKRGIVSALSAGF